MNKLMKSSAIALMASSLLIGSIDAMAAVSLKATSDRKTVTAGGSGEIDILANDIIPAGYNIANVINTAPKYGTADCSESGCTYTNTNTAKRLDGFSYTILVTDSRGKVRKIKASVTITIKAGSTSGG